MRTLYFDCIAGAAGDMVLGALVDAGLDIEALRAELSVALPSSFELTARKVLKGGVSATRVEVALRHVERRARNVESEEGMSYAQLREIIESSPLSEGVRQRSLEILARIAQAEAEVHASSPEEVVFHELGGVDTLVDICGAVIGLEMLGIERVVCSPLPLGRGFVETHHGTLPVPTPAVLILARGVPVRPLDVEGENITPTGAALVTTLADAFGPWPAMRLSAVGYGAGHSDFAAVPNLLRVAIGDADETPEGAVNESVVQLEAEMDDMPGEQAGYLMERLFAEGALDVFFVPVYMKKNRPAMLLCALAPPDRADDLTRLLFAESTTIGVRRTLVQRICLPRREEEVATPFGTVRIKVAQLGDGTERVAPEYEDCAAAARAHRVPLDRVYCAALAARREADRA